MQTENCGLRTLNTWGFFLHFKDIFVAGSPEVTLSIHLCQRFTIASCLSECLAPLSEKKHRERIKKRGFGLCDVIPEAHLFSDSSLIIRNGVGVDRGKHFLKGMPKLTGCPLGMLS